MISGNIFTLVSFVLIMTFTPGPANISSASMAVLHGYRKALDYLLGLASGVFMVMLLSGVISGLFVSLFPAVEPVLRILGAGYILYLAFAILKASYTFDQTASKPMGYVQGVLLNLLNPKLLVYAGTLFTTFLAPIAINLVLLVMAAALLALTAFSAVSTWALFGAVIKRYLHRPRVKLAVNVVLSLLLVYTAVDIAGIL